MNRMPRTITLFRLILLVLLVLSSLSVSVSALGITPAKKELQYAPGDSEYSIRILNNENKNLKLKITAKGDLAGFVELDDDLITLYIGEAEKQLRYKLHLPKELSPGTRVLEIAVQELPSDSEGKTSVSATPEVIHKVLVQVPYPGKYAQAKLYIPEGKVNGTILFEVPVMNFGTERIDDAEVEIRIFEEDKQIAALYSDSISIGSQKEAKFEMPWKAVVNNAGVYHATAIIRYDGGKEIKLEQDFYVGNLIVDIISIDVENFNLGMVARFDIGVQSRWNDNITDVFCEFRITDKNGEELTNFKTAPVDLGAFEMKEISSYWDTSSIGVGKYDARLILHYAGKVTEKLFEVQVNMDSIITPYTPTARLISGDSPDGDDYSVFIMAIILLLLVNILLLSYFRRLGKVLS